MGATAVHWHHQHAAPTPTYYYRFPLAIVDRQPAGNVLSCLLARLAVIVIDHSRSCSRSGEHSIDHRCNSGFGLVVPVWRTDGRVFSPGIQQVTDSHAD